MFYDLESNLISVKLASGKIDHVIELGNFLIHVNKVNTPLLIEILDGGKFVGQFKKISKQNVKKNLVAANS
ncbi:hypothetical protein COT95_02460 [Candidatus Falkowbacteria bacterium CG10_big_fil_rev_8_21_14_0_10_37_6]|uniref:DUF2283 domain-containing protein n=1 Tax=Candidatus Falkowbacteria bacterium CG10_big_fil_rev_8_21_14_0_10_37_6 TaxID=1974563 RepID=A0A2H0V6Q0_9BACT|nr:MAG: hypothetical protein COT95_02460 [Candidatus Falkowbacteria bacterium CG10_big_fil_rev_8_21_14_0_10_37_6]